MKHKTSLLTIISLIIGSSITHPVPALASADIPASNYVQEQSFFIAHSIPRNNQDERKVKIALITDGLVADNVNIDYTKVSKYFDAVNGKEFTATPPLDWEYYKKYPAPLGTFESGLLISKPSEDKDLAPITNNVELEIINVSDGLGTSDKIYAQALSESNLWGADLVINGSALYDYFNTDKALHSCSEVSLLAKKGVAVITPASSDGEKNTFSLADCSQSIPIGYVDKNFLPNPRAISREHTLVAIGEDVLSFINSGSEHPFTYSSSNQWSALIAGAIVAKLFSNTKLNSLEIVKLLPDSSVELDTKNKFLINYSKALAYINSKPQPLVNQDTLFRDLSDADIGRVNGILTNEKSFEVSIRPAKISNKELNYSIYYYKNEGSFFKLEKKNLDKGVVRVLFNTQFTPGSFVLVESESSGSLSRFSIPYYDSTFLASPLPSDPRAKITSFSAKWVADGLLITSTTDSKIGDSEPKNLTVVDNLNWDVLFTNRFVGNSYLLRLNSSSSLRWLELGVGLIINDSQQRLAVPPYYNTKLSLTKTGKDKYLVKGKVELRYCDSSCIKSGVQVKINDKLYKSKILPSSGEFYIYFSSKSKIKKITLSSLILRAQDLIYYS